MARRSPYPELEVEQPQGCSAVKEGCYVISVAAEMLQVHPQTLRHYERLGLVTPERTNGNIRRYSERDIARLRRIQLLMDDLGINLAGVEVILNMHDSMEQQRLEYERRLQEQRDSHEAELRRLRATLERVQMDRADHDHSVREKYEEAIHGAPASAVAAATRLLELSQQPTLGAVIARALYAVADATSHLNSKGASHAASERTHLDVLLRLLAESAPLGSETDDPLATARLRWIIDRRRLAHAEGHPMAAHDVAALLGITRQAVAKARAEGRLVGLPSAGGQYVYPSWQFGESGVLAGLREVRRALSGGDDPWTFTAFMISSNARLGGETPLTVLRRGDVDEVLRAAHAYGEHGAA